MTQRGGLDAFVDFSRPAVIAVGVPVMILAGIATYFNSRASIARQSPEAAANPQTAMMNKLALYVFPLGVVVGGPSFRWRSSCTGFRTTSGRLLSSITCSG
ncbi:putative preprotein translocase subunit YidC [Mycobacterium kansasii]|uniref:Putative preprotein translocase subunit YidC n=1 Tax=Mycobacterium kansasii TaxID=1768 RepID=A0A1V3WX24_MYCKA|nr:putative preprotein translocase subunit YidC [Mycobacterium kansasii]